MEFSTCVILILTALFTYVWYKLLKINQHWTNHGIPGPKPLPLIGNMLPVLMGRQSAGEVLKELYDAYPNEKVVGYYHFTQPRLLIRDQSLIERILVTDFRSFSSRLGEPDVINDPLNSNLFNMHGNIWSAFRSLMTPMYTPEKLRNMYPLMSVIEEDFVDLLKKNEGPIDLARSTKTLTVQVIASALGINAGPMNENDNEFQLMAFNFAPPSIVTFLKFGAIFLAPSLAQKLGINFTSEKSANYLANAFRTVLDHRKSANVRQDFVHQLMTIQQKKTVEIKLDESDSDSVPRSIPLTDDVLTGQALFMMFTGCVSTPLTLTYMIYYLAVNTDVQERARIEVQRATESDNGRVTYESLKEMRYLDACMKESLRISPLLPLIPRRCTKTYSIPDVHYTISEGENIMVSVLGVHHDSNNYPEPSKFLPERWITGDKPPSSCYLAWGIGPKMCLGMRFASIELKSVLATLLMNFKISLHPSVEQPLKSNPLSIFTCPASNILVNFDKI